MKHLYYIAKNNLKCRLTNENKPLIVINSETKIFQ